MWTSLSLISILSAVQFTLCDTQSNGIFEPYDLLFDNAVEAYYKEDWLAVILNMERALRNKAALRKIQTHCRLSCANHTAFGDPFPGVGVPIPGTGAVEDLAFFQRILKRADCVNACESEKTGPPTLHKVSEAIELEFKKRTPYNYLQVAYFKVYSLALPGEKYEQAIECAKTYLLFHPEDAVMAQNLAYYSAVLGDDKAVNITAREVVKQHIKRSLLEKELLYFGYEMFGKTFVDPDTWTPEDIIPKKLRDKQKADKETAARITEEITNLMKEIETLVEEKSKDSSDLVKLVKDDINPAPAPETANKLPETLTSSALNGSQRVVLDGVITSDECQELHRLSSEAAIQDAFKATPSPHSASEMFQDILVLKALQEDLVPLKSARLFSDLSEKIRKLLESNFGLESPLYFSSSNLVCRSAIEKQEERADCLLISELNDCIKDPSAYSDQGYSAILYLNDIFEGGDFILTESDAKTVSERLQAEELLKKLSSPLDADVQKTVMDSEAKPSEPEETVSVKTTEKDTVKTSTSAEQPTKATEDNKTDSKVVKKSEKPKAKTSKKPAKKETQTKAKADKTKSTESDKTKTTTAEKKKSKTANKTKPVTSDKKKKTGKTTVKNTADDKKTKPTTTEPKAATVEKHKVEL
ncbi:hypothetical protein cypCar_00017389 [Cyprinus carpio]|nr:hypothetical protein cypCar_00017389 [Cyprinus carpio]